MVNKKLECVSVMAFQAIYFENKTAIKIQTCVFFCWKGFYVSPAIITKTAMSLSKKLSVVFWEVYEFVEDVLKVMHIKISKMAKLLQ